MQNNKVLFYNFDLFDHFIERILLMDEKNGFAGGCTPLTNEDVRAVPDITDRLYADFDTEDDFCISADFKFIKKFKTVRKSEKKRENNARS